MKSKVSKHPTLKKKSIRKLNVPRLRHASLFSFLNSCPQSKHFSAASAGFPKVFQMWVRFGILPETKSKLALKLAVVHFQYTFEPPMFLWNGLREPFQKKYHLVRIFQNFEKMFGLPDLFELRMFFLKKICFGLVPLFFFCCLGFAKKMLFGFAFVFYWFGLFFRKKWVLIVFLRFLYFDWIFSFICIFCLFCQN